MPCTWEWRSNAASAPRLHRRAAVLTAAGRDIVAGLGDHHEVLPNAYKPYPCGIVIHPAIDACLALRQRIRFTPETVERVQLFVHPDASRLTWRKLPVTALDAQVSGARVMPPERIAGLLRACRDVTSLMSAASFARRFEYRSRLSTDTQGDAQMLDLVDPKITTEEEHIDYAQRPASLKRLRMVVVENTKKNSLEVLTQLAADLKAVHGIEMELMVRKPQRGPFTAEQLSEIRGSADFVISGIGD